MGNENKIRFIRAENISTNPQEIMNQVYDIIGVERYQHDFNYIEQKTKENDVIHQLDNNLHTINNKVEPLVDNYEEIIGKDACDMIDRDYAWYQKYFGYIDQCKSTQAPFAYPWNLLVVLL